jgi:hypothetical protein
LADSKISALTSATTPLAGTEVLPIVQSSATVKVATNDLTVRNIRANATTGILQVTGPAAASTRVVTVPDANFTAARTDAAQSFTGDQTLSTGNLVQGTAAKGINFTANTPAAGMTSQLLNWYEQGTFTPTVFGSTTAGTTTYTSQAGQYTRIGNRVSFEIYVLWTAQTGTGSLRVGNLPFTSNGGSPYTPVSLRISDLSMTVGNYAQAYIFSNSTSVIFEQVALGGGGASDIPMDTSASVMISGTYRI